MRSHAAIAAVLMLGLSPGATPAQEPPAAGAPAPETPRPAPPEPGASVGASLEWSAAALVTGTRIPAVQAQKQWKQEGKPLHVQAPASEPHAVLFGNLGIVRNQTGVDVVLVDGGRLSKGFQTTRVVRVTPGEHRIAVRFVIGTDFVDDDLLVTTMTFQPGHVYRFAALVEGGAFKKKGVIVVQHSTDPAKIPKEP